MEFRPVAVAHSVPKFGDFATIIVSITTQTHFPNESSEVRILRNECESETRRLLVLMFNHLDALSLRSLSEFSDENMMDPWNLAICFGPSLLPIPEDKNPVQFQPLVNELIKGLIVYQVRVRRQLGLDSASVVVAIVVDVSAIINESNQDWISTNSQDETIHLVTSGLSTFRRRSSLIQTGAHSTRNT